MAVTSQKLAKARVCLDALLIHPSRVRAYLEGYGMHPETIAAIMRGLETPVQLREWALAVVAESKRRPAWIPKLR